MRRPRSAHPGSRTQAWSTFVRNHACDVLACDFFVTVTARFRLLYVFVVLDVGTRRLLHWNVTEHPTAEWTVQQFRAYVTGESEHQFVVHDRDTIYSPAVDRGLRAMGLRVLKTPSAAPQANAYCERLIGTARREGLDGVIPLNERHLRRILAEWVPHYNRGHMRGSAQAFPTRHRSSRRDCQITSCPAHIESSQNQSSVVSTMSTGLRRPP